MGAEDTPGAGIDATQLVKAAADGDHEAAETLLPLVYGHLRWLARRYLAGDRAGASLSPTDLVHEAYVRLVDGAQVDWRGKTHFFAVAATQMRRLLVDRARRVATAKRGARAVRVTLHEEQWGVPSRTLDLLALDEAMSRLEERSERQCRVVELRLFGGMGVEETARTLGVSERTVRYDWEMARAWLARDLRKAGSHE